MATAHDVAEAITDELGAVGSAKLMKLLYYAQGWSLAWTNQPLFTDRIEAWVNGPVVHGTWAEYDANTGYTRTGQSSNLTESESQLILAVAERYGRYTGSELIRMTHQEDPWQDARDDLPVRRRSNRAISHDSLKNWFVRTSFEPEVESNRVDTELVDGVISGQPNALADLAEQVTGVRPSKIKRR